MIDKRYATYLSIHTASISLRTFVDEHKTQIVAGRKLLVHFPKGRCEVEASKEEANGDRFT